MRTRFTKVSNLLTVLIATTNVPEKRTCKLRLGIHADSLKLFVCNRGKIADLTGSIQGSHSNPPIQDVRFKVNYMIKMFHLPHSLLILFPTSKEAKRMSLKITKTGIIIRIVAYCEIWKYYPEIYYQESHLDLLVNNYSCRSSWGYPKYKRLAVSMIFRGHSKAMLLINLRSCMKASQVWFNKEPYFRMIIAFNIRNYTRNFLYLDMAQS